MSHLTDEKKLENAAKRQLVAEERARQVDQRIADEAKRQSHNATKTAKLRELRLAKEAAEREAAVPKVKPRKRSPK
jgi:hypothetical protein